MNRKSLFILFSLFVFVGTAFGFRSAARSPLSALDGTLVDLSIPSKNPASLIAASSNGVFVREGTGWKRSLSFFEKISPRQLVPHPDSLEEIYLVAEEGVLKGNLRTGRGRWIFRKSDFRCRVYSLALHPQNPDQIYLATERGLFLSGDGGQTWLAPFRWPENQPAHWVAFLPTPQPLFLLAVGRELFFSRDEGETFESAFSLPFSDNEPEEKIEEQVQISSGYFSSLAFFKKDPLHFWVGTREGVFESKNGGLDWEKLPYRGLEQTEVRDLVFSEKMGLVGAFSEGVAQFHPDQKRWGKIPLVLTQPPSAMAVGKNSQKGTETLLVASGNEVLEWIVDPLETKGNPNLFLPSPERLEGFQKQIGGEPTIREIQSAAIRYGGLGNGKINRWQWGSRMRAFIPRLNFGRSFSMANNVDIDRGSTNEPDRFIFGPNDFDRGWDVDLTWELGDLLYSTAQTSIDSRAKLLVELRESILGQVTRLYFERRRVQMEIASSSDKSTPESLDLLLRLEELTAQIDALTDGFLSKKLEAE